MQRQVGQVGLAGNRPAAGLRVLLGALDLAVVGLVDAVGEQEESGAGVGDGVVRDGDYGGTGAIAGGALD